MKSIEGIAIHRDRDARRERRILIKDVPMGMMERRHAEYSIQMNSPSIPLLYDLLSAR
jgi:hypothetical protein